MDRVDFTLICSDKETVPINKARLGSQSEVFGDMFNMHPAEGTEEECEVQDTAKDIRLMLSALESSGDDDWTVDELHTLITLAEKYAIKSILSAIKLNIVYDFNSLSQFVKHALSPLGSNRKLIVEADDDRQFGFRGITQAKAQEMVSIAVPLYELAARLEDDSLARNVVHFTLPFTLLIEGSEYLNSKWRQRALVYKDRAALMLHKVLMDEVIIEGKGPCRCATPSYALNTAVLRATRMIPDNLPLSPEKLLARGFLNQQSEDCEGCERRGRIAVRRLKGCWMQYRYDLREGF